MIHRTVRSAMLGVALTLGALGGAAPAALAQDARISSRAYKADEIVRVDGKLNVQATIAFGEGEKIENVAVGDSESWQIAPNKRADLLFIKPLTENARTNMTVVTDRHTYFFDLVASPKAQPIYALRFTYATPAPPPVANPAPAAAIVAAPVPSPIPVAQAAPAVSAAAQRAAEAKRAADARNAAARAEARRIASERAAARNAARAEERARKAQAARLAAEAKAAERARRAEAAKRAADARAAARAQARTASPTAAAAAVAVAPAGRAWRRSGSRDVLPRTVYDDGQSTYAVWPAGRPLPQMLVADAQGREVPVAFAVRGETIVISGVPRRIILRADGKTGSIEPPAAAARGPGAGGR